ncbi:conjugal transfer protein TraF [Rugamonas aquatica]|uniref:Thioredoxin family protein n=1 Tax=Rugamonas aquatica TaxID=2743357 RepID=A0A6A7N6C3_9BURK|nr:conjugal transfer protein TraF [Rugamonas aquatica]MQA40586.1 thioredoxin family protein [Rugamonas aquatica]
MKPMRWFTASACALWCVLACAGSGGEEDAQRRGWHFYQDPPQEEPASPPAPPRSAPVPDGAAELAQFDRLQKELQRARAVAIMKPTEDNVRRYMNYEALVMGKASQFAEVTRRVAWAAPDLDPTTQGRPVTAVAAQVYDRVQAQGRSAALTRLGHDHVLLFFFRGDCPYCHAYGPTLKRFEATYGVRVVPVSLDGGGLPEFPSARTDNGIAARLGVRQVPSVFLAQPFSGLITPMGVGVLSVSELAERMVSVAGSEREAAYGGVRTEPLN